MKTGEKIRVVHDTNIVCEYLKGKTRYDYIYQFNNLSDDQWKNVVCYGLYDNDELKEIAMVNINYSIPVLLAASFNNVEYNIELIRRMKRFLPSRFYTHIDKATLEAVFAQNCIHEYEEYLNMGFCEYDTIDKKQNNEIVRLGYKDIKDIKELIDNSYPEAWLDDESVKTNENFGAYDNGKLVSFAGILAYSEQYQVAAVAHVTTLPEYRKSGYAEKVVAELLKSLITKIQFIGLNVKVNNLTAINCYKKLGFKEFGRFIACVIEN
ncbi:MAG TPA: GNAT family N-acetyltransferase [Clostridia bacterium]|nr:GNAT family N-acetyltransferase [Clostridia bacterium]